MEVTLSTTFPVVIDEKVEFDVVEDKFTALLPAPGFDNFVIGPPFVEMVKVEGAIERVGEDGGGGEGGVLLDSVCLMLVVIGSDSGVKISLLLQKRSRYRFASFCIGS